MYDYCVDDPVSAKDETGLIAPLVAGAIAVAPAVAMYAPRLAPMASRAATAIGARGQQIATGISNLAARAHAAYSGSPMLQNAAGALEGFSVPGPPQTNSAGTILGLGYSTYKKDIDAAVAKGISNAQAITAANAQRQQERDKAAKIAQTEAIDAMMNGQRTTVPVPDISKIISEGIDNLRTTNKEREVELKAARNKKKDM